jgi:hypothetical protein
MDDYQFGKLRSSIITIGFSATMLHACRVAGGTSADICHQTGHIPVIPFDQFLCRFDSDLTWDSAWHA